MIPETVLSRPRLKDSFYKSKNWKKKTTHLHKNSKWMKGKYDDNDSSVENINKEVEIFK